METFKNRCGEFLAENSCKFESLKNEFLSSTAIVSLVKTQIQLYLNQLFTLLLPKFTYAQKLKPKIPNQSSSATKSDIVQVLNPTLLDVPIGKVKHTGYGGIVLGTTHIEGISKLLEKVEKELSSRYEVHSLRSTHHRVRIVGMSKCHNETL